MNNKSKWKNPFFKLKKKVFLKKQIIEVKASRNTVVLPKFVGSKFYVHNGKNYVEITVSTEMIGHKFGEFVFTRSKFVYKKKKKK